MSTRIPALLEPYLALPPEASLIVLTSVLGASSNWLVLRHLYSYLKASSSSLGTEGEQDGIGVVLVSFMRDGSFWRDGAGKLGLDLEATKRNGRFAFVDGLTGLFTDEHDTPTATDRLLKGGDGLEGVRVQIEAALGDVRGSKKVLVVDQLDAYLAASDEGVTSTALSAMLLSLRERAHATLLTFAADDPLLHAQATTLEREHAALVLGQAHAAERVVALRMLDTGTARDVSGVVRITGPGWTDGDGGDGPDGEEGREFLYYVAGDGGVRVFERGT